MTNQRPRISLQTILGLDAATCAGMGVLLLAASGPVAALTQIPGPLLFGAGLLLLPVAVLMVVFSRAAVVPAWVAQLVVTGNVLWVLASLILPISGMIAPNGLGWAFLLIQSAAVSLFAALEWAARPGAAAVA